MCKCMCMKYVYNIYVCVYVYSIYVYAYMCMKYAYSRYLSVYVQVYLLISTHNAKQRAWTPHPTTHPQKKNSTFNLSNLLQPFIYHVRY